LVPFAKQRRIVPIGRLDRNASGLILLTNDYEWHTILSHPRYEHSKRYKVELYNGVPARAKLQAIQNGLELPDEPRPLNPIEDFEVIAQNNTKEIATVKFTLTEGRYRQIRRMFEYLGHPVKSVKRTEFGLLKLDRELRNGDWRQLTPKEIKRLKGPTILKRPTKQPYALKQQQSDMESRLDKASVDDEEIPAAYRGRYGRGEGRQTSPRGQGRNRDNFDRSNGRRENSRRSRSDEREWDDSEEDGRFDRAAPRDRQRGKFRNGQRRRNESYNRWGDADEGASFNQQREQPQSDEFKQPQVRDVSFFQADRGDRDSDLVRNVRSRVADGMQGFGRRREKDRRQSGNRDEAPDAREATMEDLQRLQERFNAPPAPSPGPAPQAQDGDWEADWVKQLDAMQAKRSEQK